MWIVCSRSSSMLLMYVLTRGCRTVGGPEVLVEPVRSAMFSALVVFEWKYEYAINIWVSLRGLVHCWRVIMTSWWPGAGL